MTDALPISRFPVPDLANMPKDILNRTLAEQKKSGFIPNVFLVLAHRPDEFRAFLDNGKDSFHEFTQEPSHPGATAATELAAQRAAARVAC